MIRRAVVRAFDGGAHTATVELLGSAGTYLSGVPVAANIASGEITPGQSCAVVFFHDGGNPADAVVFAVWA